MIKLKLMNLFPNSNYQVEKYSLPESNCFTLRWKQKKLFVKQSSKNFSSLTFTLESEKWLVDCLKKSSVKVIYLDPSLDKNNIEFWAHVCKQVNKPVILRIPRELKQKKNKLFWGVKRLLDVLAAALLLLVLSPLILLLALMVKVTSPGPIFFRQWRVGYRGQLFEILKFRSMVVGAEKLHYQVMGEQEGLHKCLNDTRITSLGNWMRKYSLDELPQLINVLRGELSLVGPRPWALYDALRFKPPEERLLLKAMPGITGPWQVEGRSQILNLEQVSQIVLNYLSDWSLKKDMLILIQTIPNVILGKNAY